MDKHISISKSMIPHNPKESKEKNILFKRFMMTKHNIIKKFQKRKEEFLAKVQRRVK